MIRQLIDVGRGYHAVVVSFNFTCAKNASGQFAKGLKPFGRIGFGVE